MSIFARPYDVTRSVENNVRLVEAFANNPDFLTYPHPRDVAERVGIHILTDPNNIIFESWRGRDFVGIIILQRVNPHVDALLHFLFLDKDLVGKRKLLTNFIGFCFTDLGFNRLSMEVPEGARLERFARKVLGFKYEGEGRPRNPELPASLTDNWVAKQGSRIEQAHFNGVDWKDVLRLRLLASEWVGTGEGEPHAASSNTVGRSGGHSPHQ